MFSQPSIDDYYRELPRSLRQEIGGEDPAYILSVDVDSYVEHWIEKARGHPLVYHFDRKEVEQVPDNSEITIDAGPFPRSPQRVRLRIPTDEHAELEWFLKHDPPTRWMSAEPKWEFDGGDLVFTIEPTPETVKDVERKIEFWIGGRNRAIEAGNSNLARVVREVVESVRSARRESATAMQAALGKLGIPLRQTPDAHSHPVRIQPRQLRRIPPRPDAPTSQEPQLQPSDVRAFFDFIDQYARQFEVTPRVFSGLSEPDLRDLLLGMANTNYPGQGTAETFSKLGKTDISWRADHGHVLVIECKYWSGAQAYIEALEQLFGYLTWRQSYAGLVTFCRSKDMSASIAKAHAALTAHATHLRSEGPSGSGSRWISRHTHPQDKHKGVEVNHLFYDLAT